MRPLGWRVRWVMIISTISYETRIGMSTQVESEDQGDAANTLSKRGVDVGVLFVYLPSTWREEARRSMGQSEKPPLIYQGKSLS